MAAPTPFDRQTSFRQFSSQYPAKPHNGASLDAEFNAVKTALDETQASLALIQDDDGELARGSVGRAQLDSSITIGFEAPSSWQVDTEYTADISTVFYTARFYIALESHTSGDTFDASKWEEIADLSASAAIDDGSITDAKLATDSVVTDKIQNLAVTTAKLASSAVTTAKIADNAVTLSKFALGLTRDLANILFPAGFGPLPWYGLTPPTGWVFAGAYLRTDYPALSAYALAEAAAGNPNFTDGNGTTTFSIRPLAGQALVGVDASSTYVDNLTTLGAQTGVKNVVLTAQHLPSNIPNSATNDLSGAGADLPMQGFAGTGVGQSLKVSQGSNNGSAYLVTAPVVGTISTTVVINPDGDYAHTNVQPSTAVNFIFKAH